MSNLNLFFLKNPFEKKRVIQFSNRINIILVLESWNFKGGGSVGIHSIRKSVYCLQKNKKIFEVLRSWDAINKHTDAFTRNIHKNILHITDILFLLWVCLIFKARRSIAKNSLLKLNDIETIQVIYYGISRIPIRIIQLFSRFLLCFSMKTE